MNFKVVGARLWRGGEASLEALTSPLAVRAGRIVEATDRSIVEEADASTTPARLPEVDLRDRFIVPGLIDAHVHLELDPKLRTPKDQEAVPDAERRAGMAKRAARMLAAGITTARDCGGGAHRELALRGDIEAGTRPGPRLLCCGQPLTTPGGHCHFWGGEVASRDEIEAHVGRQVEAGSDWLKVMATGGVFTPGTRARDTQFDGAALRTIVESAARAGRSVAAHCHGTEGIALAARAGVRTIEHASFAGPDGFGTALDAALLREMASLSLWISPTVNAGWGRRMKDKERGDSDFFQRMSGSLRAQRDAGLRFIASTDAGIPGVDHADLVAGLEAFAAFADLAPIDVLRAATSESARALGIDHETGTLQPGRSADFLVLDANPLEDLAALRDPEYVVAGGRFHDRATRQAWGNAG